MDEEFEEDGWMGRHRSGEDEVCAVCFGFIVWHCAYLCAKSFARFLGWS